MLTCEVTKGDEENIEIMWYNSKQSGVVGQSKQLDLSNIKLSDGEPSYMAVYWCSAKNSDGTGLSENVTVQIVSSGIFTLSILVFCSCMFINCY